MSLPYRKKLIEVALPLPELNDASAYDKMPGIGPHPKGIHHWWARLPLPAARAILFASVVDDPESHPEKWPTEDAQNKERERLFNIVRRMLQKRLHEHPEVYEEAHREMLEHCEQKLPAVFDPFAGGGSIPLEANRLGFEAHAADLNPIAVLLNKCNLEIAPRWLGAPPINPEDRGKIGGEDSWTGLYGLAADIRYYGKLVQQRAREKIGHLYPPVKVTSEMAKHRPDLKSYIGKELTVIAWIWARTVASPNPSAQGTHVPLISTYWLSSKKGKEAWLEPVVDKASKTYRFVVRTGNPNDRALTSAGTKGSGGFRCLLTDDPITFKYASEKGQEKALGLTPLAAVVELTRGRTYIEVPLVHAEVAASAHPTDYPDTDLPEKALGFRIQNYGFRKHWQMFTPRQLATLVTLSDLIRETRGDMLNDAKAGGHDEARAYADTVATFLALALDRCADFNNAFCRWKPSGEQSIQLFARAAIPMVWDFVEPNTLGTKAVCWHTAVDLCADAVETIAPTSGPVASARQADAASGSNGLQQLLISTDPPYYDNIGYAALSDFFYVWLRRTVGDLYPEVFATVLVPKIPELTASPERFDGDAERAKAHFEEGFRQAFTALRSRMDARFPLTVYYAFKQDDEEGDEEVGTDLTTGWETLLEALVGSGFRITATWPIRASQQWRIRAMGSNALASYIVLACRPRSEAALQVDRRSFIAALKRELPAALRHLQQGNIAPVDFAQAALGPGMAVFSQYSRILESDGRPMSVRSALGLINQTLTEVLSELEDEFDPDTRWAIAWFDQYGFNAGSFGDAEVLSKAKVTSINGLQQAGLVISRGGEVRLLKPDELPENWDPATDKRLTAWETVHHLIRALSKGENTAADLVARLGSNAHIARELAYQLFGICERRKRSLEAQAYNGLVISWPEILRLTRQMPAAAQTDLFEEH